MLETLKLTVTIPPVSAGLGLRPPIVTVGTGAWMVTGPVFWPVEPLLSVAVTVTVYGPGEVYVWVSDVAAPDKVSSGLESPQLMV